jgi:hypothetical protein
MSVYSFLGELQTAVYASLVADATLSAAVTGVYDLVPPDAVCPYIALTGEAAAPLRTKTRWGQRLTLAITVFSAEAGLRQAQEIAAQVMRIMNEGSFTFAGAVVVMVQPRTVALDFDEGSRKVTARLVFEAVVQEDI